MEKMQPNPTVNQIELLALACRRDSLLRFRSQAVSRPGCTSVVAWNYNSRQWEPEWVSLPGLYLLDENLDFFRRVKIHHDHESFAISGHAPFAAQPEVVLSRFAVVTLDDDGEFMQCELFSQLPGVSPTILGREQISVLVGAVNAI